MGGACGMYGGEDKCLQNFGGKNLWGKRPLEKLRPRWEANIKMDF